MHPMSTSHNNIKQFEKRKRDHIEQALFDKNQCYNSELDSLTLIHEALPDLDFDEIDTTIQSLGEIRSAPFFISSMTAGHKGSVNINEVLAVAAAETGWSMGVGSQRRELTDNEAQREWQKIRAKAPNVSLYGNLGIAQIITHSRDNILRLIENIQAKALFVHLNPLQECIQPEGTPQFKGGFEALEKLCTNLPVPVIIKETGCGFSKNTLTRLNQLPIAAVDVSGTGGTHWGRIEGARTDIDYLKQTAHSFKNWGISTFQSLMSARDLKPSYEIWASGGVRSGLDAAKYLAMGAQRIGIAKPMLEAALNGVETVIETMRSFEYQLKTALFCTGSENITALRETDKWQIKI